MKAMEDETWGFSLGLFLRVIHHNFLKDHKIIVQNYRSFLQLIFFFKFLSQLINIDMIKFDILFKFRSNFAELIMMKFTIKIKKLL